jgi:toxin ParE1/3/4
VPYSLSEAAAEDLREIAQYTVRAFGVRQAKAYGDGLRGCFTAMVENPFIGRSYDRIRPGLRCFDHKSHAIYYILQDNGVLIVRVLHVRQDALRHL